MTSSAAVDAAMVLGPAVMVMPGGSKPHSLEEESSSSSLLEEEDEEGSVGVVFEGQEIR